MIIQFLIVLFSLFALYRLWGKFKAKEVSGNELFAWSSFLIIVIVATIWFKQTDIIANFFGVEKGADLAIYISIIVLFYLQFKSLVKIDNIEKNITKIVRELALRANKEKDN